MKKKYQKFLIIPDTQVKPGVPTSHLEWAGKYVKEQKPDVLIHLGDHWDMPSLSSYDRGKKAFEGRRYKSDIEAGNKAMDLFTKQYRGTVDCEEVFLIGNHEERIERAVEADAVLEGVIGYQDLNLAGWNVVPYRKVIERNGVAFCHYFYNPMTGRPWSGQASSVLKNVGQSFVQGHRQGLDIALQQLPSGKRRRGVICGSFYQHDESYLGPQGDHWRGLLVLHEVRDGDFDIMEVSLDFLRRRYG